MALKKATNKTNVELIELGAIRKSRAPSVARAAAVLRLLAGQQAGLGVTDIARRVDLVPSTCLHVLRALVDEGFLVFDTERKIYRTGDGLVVLVRDALLQYKFAHAVQPYLDEQASTQGVTALGLEMDNRGRMVVVAVSRPERFISLHVCVGHRLPQFISATGRCYAAISNLSREELYARFSELRWQKPPKFEDWLDDIERAKVDGVAVDYGNNLKGVRVVATLLSRRTDPITRGIALIGFESDLTDRVIEKLKLSLKNVATNFLKN